MGYERPSGGPALGAGGLQNRIPGHPQAKNGTPATPLSGLEMSELRRHQREMHDGKDSCASAKSNSLRTASGREGLSGC